MTTVLTYSRESSIGFKVRRLRLSEYLTQQELANMAGVSLQEVALFERNMLIPLDSRRKILKALWAKKARKG